MISFGFGQRYHDALRFCLDSVLLASSSPVDAPLSVSRGRFSSFKDQLCPPPTCNVCFLIISERAPVGIHVFGKLQ